MKESAATIVFDKKAGPIHCRRLGHDRKQQTGKEQKLEPGDVINIAGTVVVYNDPSENGIQSGGQSFACYFLKALSLCDFWPFSVRPG